MWDWMAIKHFPIAIESQMLQGVFRKKKKWLILMYLIGGFFKFKKGIWLQPLYLLSKFCKIMLASVSLVLHSALHF